VALQSTCTFIMAVAQACDVHLFGPMLRILERNSDDTLGETDPECLLIAVLRLTRRIAPRLRWTISVQSTIKPSITCSYVDQTL
jgi:hypothetical protein